MKSPRSRHIACIPAGSFAALSLVASLSQTSQADTLYWDTNSTTSGFGNTTGLAWDSSISPYWSTNSIGIAAPAAFTTTTSDTAYFGTHTDGLANGGSATVSVSGTQNVGNLTFGSQSGAITLSGGTAINLAAASTITVNNAADTITTPLSGAGTSLIKLGSGTLTLNGANTYTGTTIIKNGSLQIGDGTTGSLGSTPSTYTGALTFKGTGTFNVQEAASSNQGMGTLSFNAGQGKVQNTFNATSSTLTFSGMNARSAGATANFTTSGGTNGTDNKIVLSSATNAPMSNSGSNNPGMFFGLDSLSTAVSYARYDATGSGFFRATNYSGDTNATATAGTYNSAVDLSIVAATTPNVSVSLNTLRAVPTANNQNFSVGTTGTLSINGILAVVPSTGVQFRIGTGTQGQGFLQPTTDGGEVVFAVARGNNSALGTSSLAVGNIIQDFSGGSAGTKVTTESNATMVFQASNTYTGVTTINSGLLRILRWADAGSASGLGKGSTGTTPNAADIVINGGILNFGNAGTGVNASTNRLFTIGPAGATLDVSGNSGVTGTLTIGSAGGNIAFSDSNAPASLTLAHNAPAASSLGTGTLGAVLGDPGTGTNVTSLTKTHTGTWILTAANTHSGVTRITGGTLQLGNNLALQNSIFDPSGGGTLAFSSGIDTPTLGGLTSSTNLTLASNVTALTLNPGTGVTTNYSGILGSATSGMTLTKTGAGTQVLSGVNTYSGATNVNVGTLTIHGSGSINASSGVTVAAGAKLVYNSSTALTNPLSLSGAGTSSRAILGGTGTISTSVTLDNLGDTLSPGNSPGIQTFSPAQTWSSFSYDWEVNNFTGTTAGTDFDQLGLGSTLNLTGGSGSYILNILSLTALDVGGNVPNFSEINRSWTILTSSGITGFNAADWTLNLNPGGFTNAETGTWSVAQSGNDLVLSYAAVPEPNVAALLGGLGTLMVLRRRRA